MKVLKAGLVTDPVLRGTCTSCGCEVECVLREVTVSRGESNSLDRAVPCPQEGCARLIAVRTVQVPRSTGSVTRPADGLRSPQLEKLNPGTR